MSQSKTPQHYNTFAHCVLIGNSDNKLTQAEWSAFCHELRITACANGRVQFYGCPSSDYEFQNCCAVVDSVLDLPDFYEELRSLAGKYGQDSIAIFGGAVTFAKP